MNLLDGISKNIRDHNLIQQGESLLVAVSGGLDSVALFHAVIELRNKWKWPLVVSHFNHQLRGAESDRDEAFVCNLAIQSALPCISGRGDVRQTATNEKISLEMAARKLRHQFFGDAARRLGIKKIVLAHTLDDQIELFFLRLIRGAGAGLAGMPWQNRSFVDGDLYLARPLLNIPKSALKDWSRHNGHTWIEDESNTDLTIPRNWIRHELLPSLCKRFPGFESSLAKTMEIIRDEKAFLQSCGAAYDCEKQLNFDQMPTALQREVLRQQLHHCNLEETYDLVEALRTKSDANVSIGPERFARRSRTGSVAVTEAAEVRFGESSVLSLHLKGSAGVFALDDIKFKWEVEPHQQGRPLHRHGTEYFDAEKVGSRVIIRHWRQGDRFQPIGMKYAIKLHDFFVNNKINRTQRHQLVVATTENGEIFWVEECRIAERFKLDKTSRRRLKWAWHRDSACG